MVYVQFMVLIPTDAAGVFDVTWHTAGGAFGGFAFATRAEAERFAEKNANGRPFRITD